MISVIIPALNEAARIAGVVATARRGPGVGEVLVVDDGSTDGTPDVARAAGATVLSSTLLGKGASMEDGLRAARHDVVVYLDGDLTGLADDVVGRLAGPVLRREADFVKARFARRGGRVTALTARPLLRAFFPEVADLAQPLGGVVAAGRGLLRRLRFENDYGVDVGLLLDAAAAGAVIREVEVGRLEHDSQPLEALGDMAAQVTRTVLDRAARYGRLTLSHVHATAEAERRRGAGPAALLRPLGRPARLALFDMDGTLLDGRFITALARDTNRALALTPYLGNPALDPETRARRIAAVFAGVPREQFEATARAVPLMPGAVAAVVGLRKAGYRVGLVTDSYCLAADVVRRRVFADFSIAHLLSIRHGRATGDLTLAPAMRHPGGCPQHPYCKRNVLLHLWEQAGVPAGQVLAVGDGENDVCLLRASGTSVAFRPRTPAVGLAARHLLRGSLADVLGAAALSPGPARDVTSA